MAKPVHNQARVRKVEKLIKAGDYEEGEVAVRDMLADLRHYCDANGIIFHEQDRIAHNHYTHELQFTD